MFTVIYSALVRFISKIVCHRVLDVGLCVTYACAFLHLIEPDEFKMLAACFYLVLAVKN
ncbi:MULTISPECIES: hypothetical protein [Rhizobium]|uniref:hypothetical protein n=1 Tax=Rhizobium TaxID=379 RepID=UPI001C8FC3EC|nr:MULTISPECIES: hypothetical protein [Rhizobium]MBY3271439.1 hypothetical protein [Rhizobium laguerreae]MBY5741054.1 hypothetical protein [Rhizobium leguminosarum]